MFGPMICRPDVQRINPASTVQCTLLHQATRRLHGPGISLNCSKTYSSCALQAQGHVIAQVDKPGLARITSQMWTSCSVADGWATSGQVPKSSLFLSAMRQVPPSDVQRQQPHFSSSYKLRPLKVMKQALSDSQIEVLIPAQCQASLNVERDQ